MEKITHTEIRVLDDECFDFSQYHQCIFPTPKTRYQKLQDQHGDYAILNDILYKTDIQPRPSSLKILSTTFPLKAETTIPVSIDDFLTYYIYPLASKQPAGLLEEQYTPGIYVNNQGIHIPTQQNQLMSLIHMGQTHPLKLYAHQPTPKPNQIIVQQQQQLLTIGLQLPGYLMQYQGLFYHMQPAQLATIAKITPLSGSILKEPHIIHPQQYKHPFVFSANNICKGEYMWENVPIKPANTYPLLTCQDRNRFASGILLVLQHAKQILLRGYKGNDVHPVRNIKEFTPVASSQNQARFYAIQHGLFSGI